MKLYFSKGACSLAVRIIINELNLTCDYEAVNLETKQTEFGHDFYKTNPKGSVPALALDNGEILTENTVIQQYLADVHHAHELLSPLGDFKRYRILEWLNFVSTEFHKRMGPLFNPKVPQTINDEIFIPVLKSKLTYVDKHLKDNNYLVGDHFTLPDSYCFVVLRWMLLKFKFDLNKEWPNVARYYETLKQRKAIIKSLQEEKISA